MLKLDKRLSKLAIKFNANYTRYADDITFSGDRNISKMIPIILKIIEDNAIYYCKKFGVDKHMANINCKRPFYKEHLYGIAYFIKMIDQNLGNKYINELDTIEWSY